MFKKVIILFFSVCIAIPAISQEEIKTDSLRKDALKVYMDASDYLKQNIPYINYVRDRKVADLVIISTSQRSGSGGREYSFFLEGQGKFRGMIDTLVFSSSPDDTYEQIRSKRVKVLRMGLIRYVQKTPLADYVNISFTEPISSEVSTDKWNNWVFRASLSGYLNGQSSYKYLHAYGGLSASRVTEDWKIDINTNYSYGLDQFEIDEEILQQIAEELYISKYYLSHFFKENTGFTVIEFVNSKRIIEAQKMLIKSSTNITDIAVNVGFNSLTHFERTFKKINGITPSQYREIER